MQGPVLFWSSSKYAKQGQVQICDVQLMREGVQEKSYQGRHCMQGPVLF